MELGVAPLISFSWTLLFNIITVLVLFLVLKVLFFEKVHNFMMKRQETIKDAFDSAETINKKADLKMAEYEKSINNLEIEGREIISEAKSKADEKAKKIIEDAVVQANTIKEKARREIAEEKEKSLLEMKSEITSLAIMMAQKVLEKELEQTEEQDKIVEEIIKEVGTSKWQN
ncbi:MAG: F0F1 ATP synthase subunit B [Anaerovoracaceae bacterium]